MWQKFIAWCGSNTAAAKCARTIFQGIIGAIIAYVPDIIAGGTVIPAEYKAAVVALIMAILSPLQAMLGSDGQPAEEQPDEEE